MAVITWTDEARQWLEDTGISMQSTDLVGKRVQMLREFVPKATRVAVLVMKGTPATPLLLAQIRAVAKQIGLTLLVHEVNDVDALVSAFTAMQRAGAQVLFVQQSPFALTNLNLIVDLAARHRLPALFESRPAVDAGALIAYGPSIADNFRRAAHYVDLILKGAKPADLPVEQPTKFEPFINAKTAKALGLKIPQSLLISADKVIE